MLQHALIDKSLAPTPRGKPVSKRVKYKWASDSKPGVFMMISKRVLHIDEEVYQRCEVSKAKVLEIARDFDWRLFGVLSVVLRKDGIFYVFDGGHRKRAADYRDDIDELPCMVFETESLADEARGFVGANKMKSNVSSFYTFRASVVAGDPVAIAANKILSDHGLEPKPSGSNRYGFRAINTLVNMVRRDAGMASKVMALCVEIAGETGPISGDVMAGLEVLARREEIGDDIFNGPLAKKLIETGMDVLERSISRSKSIHGKGGELVIARGILDVLNKGKRNKITL